MVYEDASGDPPTQARLDDWILSYGLTTNVVVPRDADDALDAFERRECAYVVETEGMTITWKSCTCTGGDCVTSAETGLAALESALAGH